MCVDCQCVNAVSKVDAYPTLRADQMTDQVCGLKNISNMDLTIGYWQVPVQEEHQEKTSFVTPFSHFQLNSVSFGRKQAPATFQRLFDKLLAGLSEFANANTDDMLT